MTISKRDVQEIIGEEFTVREPESMNVVELELRLSAVSGINRSYLYGPEAEATDILLHERDRMLINMKREVTKLLWKYLGEVADD